MFIKRTEKKFADGTIKTQITTVESYRPYPGADPKQRQIENYGYLEDQSDPDTFIKELEAEIEENRKQKKTLAINIDFSRMNNDVSNWDYNYAPYLLASIYKQLHLDDFFKTQRSSKATYDLEKIFRYILLMTLVSPDSKRATYMEKGHIYGFEEPSFVLHHIYRALDEIEELKDKLDTHLDNEVSKLIKRDKSYSYLDVTNIYQEKDFPVENTLGQRGVSKEHRTEPIVQIGVLLDNHGLPFYSDVFPGNTSDTLILEPMIKKIREKKLKEGRIIVVADKGLNSSTNIDLLVNQGDGFLFSQILKGKKGKRYHSFLEDDSLFTCNKDGTYKYYLFDEEYEGEDVDGKKVKRKRKVLIYWNKAEAEKARHKREEKLKRAKKALEKKSYGMSHGADAYLKKEVIDSSTGEACEAEDVAVAVDYDKAEAEAKFDGFFCLITSEMEYDERKMREVYHNLWMIEESFRIMKSDEFLRPLYLSLDEHIEAHIHIKQIALLFIRLIQMSLKDYSLSAERIKRVFSHMVLDIPANGIVHLHEVGGKSQFENYTDKKGHIAYSLKETGNDEVFEDFLKICEALHIDINKTHMRQELFNKELKKATVTLQK